MTLHSSIIRVAIATPLRKTFDYVLDTNYASHTLLPGMRVKIPFKNRQVVGVILEITDHTTIPLTKLKSINEIIDTHVLLEQQILKLCHWVSDYYQYAIGEAVFAAMPTLLRKGKTLTELENSKRRKKTLPPSMQLQTSALQLNNDQQQAIASVLKSQHEFKTFLLDGVTGSGKTEVYLKIIEATVARGAQALVLVPEIALTPQTLVRFRERFQQPVVAMHSDLNETERFHAWMQSKNGTAAIVIGTRSAVFTSFKNLGIIIVDEEHDTSFKQHEGLRYSARDVAIMRAHLSNIPIVLGSATPSLETLHNAWTKKYQHLRLHTRAGGASMPRFKTIDLRKQKLTAGMSDELIQKIKQHVQQQNQVLLFLNRRGFAPTLLCHNCGWIANCKRCDAHLTVHQKPAQLFCHHCGFLQSLVKQCSDCKSEVLISLGLGTEKLEFALQQIFPDVGIARIDRDNIRRKDDLPRVLEEIHSNKKQILIGTQMLAKGHHFPNVTLVAIVDGDAGLFSGDFRAPEHMGQLILQVAGRAGRAEKMGEVVIQTHQPENPLLQNLLRHGYHPFMQQLASDRATALWPPFSAIVLLRAESVQKPAALKFLQNVQEIALSLNASEINLLGPIPTPMERRANHFRAQLLFQAKSRKPLQQFLPKLTSAIEESKIGNQVRWSLDVDPVEAF